MPYYIGDLKRDPDLENYLNDITWYIGSVQPFEIIYPEALRTRIIRLLSPKTLQNEAFGLF